MPVVLRRQRSDYVRERVIGNQLAPLSLDLREYIL